MKDDLRRTILAACRSLDSAQTALLGTLDKVDCYRIRNGLNDALQEMRGVLETLDRHIVGKDDVATELRTMRVALDQTILTLELHARWFDTWTHEGTDREGPP